MVSLWNSSKNGEEQPAEGEQRPTSSSQAQPARHSEDANERTRLLPRPARGYLDPDDPAVWSHNVSEVDTLTGRRSALTTYGVYALFATSKSSSS